MAPLTVPVMAELWGWETAFIVVGLVGFVWLGIWQFVYKRPEENTKMNAAERAYINQDIEADAAAGLVAAEAPARKMSFVECMKYRQTWAFAFGKFMTDGVWWFFLFWTPAYLKAQYGMVGHADRMADRGALHDHGVRFGVRRKISDLFHQPGYEPLCRTYAGDADYRVFSARGTVGAAAGIP